MAAGRSIRAGAAYVELFTKDARFIRGLRRAQYRLRAFGMSAVSVGRQMMMATAVLAAPLVGGVKVFADFEKQMANVSTMLDRPAEHMDRFRAGIRSMSVEFGESTDTLSRGLYDILSASIAPAKALDVLAVSAKAAKAGLTDTGVAADAITTILNSYKLSADQAGSVSDLLFAIVKKGKTTFAELAPSIGMVASTASVAGVPLEELGAMIATLTRNGVQTANAVTAVNRVIATFLKPTDDAAAYAKTLGFDLSSTTLHAEGLEGVFRKIATLPPDAIARLFPNIRALRGVLPALQDMSGLTEDIAFMANRAGRTEEAYAKMAATLSHAFDQLKQKGVLLLSVIGEQLAEAVRDAGTQLMTFADWFVDLIQQNKDLVVAAAGVVVTIGAVGAALVVVGVTAQTLAFAIGGLIMPLTAAATLLSTLAGVAAFVVSPIGLVIAGLIAAAATFEVFWSTASRVVDQVGDLFAGLKNTVAESIAGIVDALKTGDLRMAWQIGVKGLEVVWLETTDFLMQKWGDLTAWIVEAWTGAIAGIKEIGYELFGPRFDSMLQDLRGLLGLQQQAKGIKTHAGKGTAVDPDTITKEDRIAAAWDKAEQAAAEHRAGAEADRRRRRAELDAAKRDLDDLTRRAADKRQTVDMLRGLPSADELDQMIAEMFPGAAAGGQAATAAGQAAAVGTRIASEVRGTFSAYGLRGLAAGGRNKVEDKQLGHLEAIDENIEALLTKAQDHGLTFTNE